MLNGGRGGDLIRGMVQLQHKGIKAISNVEKKLAEAEHGVQERLGYDQNLLKDAVGSVPWKTENPKTRKPGSPHVSQIKPAMRSR